MTYVKTTFFFFTVLLIAFTSYAQNKLQGYSDIGEYTVDVNPNRGTTGASYIKFKNVVNEVRISTTKKADHNIITLKLDQIPVLVFSELANKQLAVLEAPVSKKWPHLIDQEKAKTYLGKSFSYTDDSYQKAVELFAELLSLVSKREVGLDEKIMWYSSLVYYGQYDQKNANGTGKLYDYETNELYLSCDKFLKALCQGKGKQYDVSMPAIIYEGNFVDSNRDGTGKEWLKGKSYLEGNYIADKKEGPFTHTGKETEDAHGYVAKGNYKNNQKDGSWHYKLDNGKEIQYVFETGKLLSKTILTEATPSLMNQEDSISSKSNNEVINTAILKSVLRSIETINEDMDSLNNISNAFSRASDTFSRNSGRKAKTLIEPYLKLMTSFWSKAIGDSELTLTSAWEIANKVECQHSVEYIEHLQYINKSMYKKMNDLHTRTKTFIDNRNKDDDVMYFNHALESLEQLYSVIETYVWKAQQATNSEYLCRDEKTTNNQPSSKPSSIATSEHNDKAVKNSPAQVVEAFLNALFVNEDKATAESYISPSFLRQVEKINVNAVPNAYASSRSQYEIVRQNGKRVLVNLYLLKGSKQLYNELTFSVEAENGHYYIKPNIRDYDRSNYYDPWVDFDRVEK